MAASLQLIHNDSGDADALVRGDRDPHR